MENTFLFYVINKRDSEDKLHKYFLRCGDVFARLYSRDHIFFFSSNFVNDNESARNNIVFYWRLQRGADHSTYIHF